MIKVAAKPPPERMAQSELPDSFFEQLELIDSHGLEEQAQVRSPPQGEILEYRN